MRGATVTQNFLLLIFAIGIFPSVSFTGSLKDFKKGTQEEQKKKSTEAIPIKRSEPKEEKGFFSLLGQFFAMLWVNYNLTTYYASYPYATESYVNGPDFNDEVSSEETTFQNVFIPAKVVREHPEGYQHYSLSLHLGAQYLTQETVSVDFGLRGLFWGFIGPAVNAHQIIERGESATISYWGIELALVQTRYFSITALTQVARFGGILPMAGTASAMRLQIFPVHPFRFELTAGGVWFGTLRFVRYEARAAYHLNRTAFYVGYRGLVAQFSPTTELSGVTAGIEVWF